MRIDKREHPAEGMPERNPAVYSEGFPHLLGHADNVANAERLVADRVGTEYVVLVEADDMKRFPELFSLICICKTTLPRPAVQINNGRRIINAVFFIIDFPAGNC